MMHRYNGATSNAASGLAVAFTDEGVKGQSLKVDHLAISGRFTSVRCIVIALMACVLLALAACASGSPSQSSAAQEESESFSSESIDDVEQPSSSAAQEPSASPQADAANLSWRNEDFAVDPNRREWNYEGNGRKVVYLTIDDGPSQNTQAVLDILDKYNCKATFFVIGQDPEYFPMIKEAYDRGHTIGLHSYSHDYAYVYSSTGAFFDDLGSIGQLVESQIGYVPCFIRFPGGSSNTVSADYSKGIMSSLVDMVQAEGYQYYDWNVSSGDGAECTADELVANATAPTELENIVLLCHDSATKQSTVEALPRIIEHYQSLGYTFEALDRTSFVAHHGVNN